MRARSPVIELLLREKNPAADDALATALACASNEGIQPIVEAILTRNQPVGLYGLVENFHLLDGPARQRVLDDGDQVFRALREAFSSKDDRVRLNVLELIRQARLYRAAYLLEAGLHDRQPRVRDAAAEALYGLADALLSSEPKPPDGDGAPQGWEQQRLFMSDLESRREDRRQLAAALATSVASFQSHLQPKVIAAAMWLVDDIGPRLWASISGSSSRALYAAIAILEQGSHPRLVPFAVKALGHTELRPHVLRILANRCDPDFLIEWLRQGWRLAEPRLARNMAAIKELACIQDQANGMLQLPANADRHLSRWIRLTGLSSETRVTVLKELYRRGGSELRRSAVWALTEYGDERAIRLLRAIAGGKDLECSPIARLELARRFPGQFPPGDLLAEVAGTTAVQTARSPQAPITLERYWNEFEQMSQEERLHLGSTVVARAPRSWALLNRHLTNPDAEYRVRALKIIVTLGLSATFADQLYTLSYDPQPEVRSAAVLALGQIPNATSRRILNQAMLDPDHRVQANAVEAADESGQASSETLLSKLASADNRVRANAVKALLKLGVREAAQTLLNMLRDADRRQRASALWLIEKMELFTLAGHVVQMASKDQDVHVRTRAAAVRDRMIGNASAAAEAPGTAGELQSASATTSTCAVAPPNEASP